MSDFEFEDLDAWQEAKALTVKVYQHTEKGGWTLDFLLRDETRRAAMQIGKEIARGYGLGTNVDVRRQLRKARSAGFTLQALLCVGRDLGYGSTEDYKVFCRAIRTLVRMIDDLARDATRRLM